MTTAVPDISEAITDPALKETAVSQSRVAVMMALTSEQLRLVADWLTGEASTATRPVANSGESYDLVSKGLVQELLEHADFREGHLNG